MYNKILKKGINKHEQIRNVWQKKRNHEIEQELNYNTKSEIKAESENTTQNRT